MPARCSEFSARLGEQLPGVVLARQAWVMHRRSGPAKAAPVSVEHGEGLRTTYEPVAATVAVGAAVRRGDPLGTLEPGHAGCPFGACLHWGLRRPAGTVTEYLDPLLLLGLGRVRLLPAGP